jgi:hypothetical protein
MNSMWAFKHLVEHTLLVRIATDTNTNQTTLHVLQTEETQDSQSTKIPKKKITCHFSCRLCHRRLQRRPW